MRQKDNMGEWFYEWEAGGIVNAMVRLGYMIV